MPVQGGPASSNRKKLLIGGAAALVVILAAVLGIVVFGGGIIPQRDRAELLERGVAGVFGPGATMADIVAWVREHVPEREVG